MRGGEKVLEVLVGLLPRAPIFTLFHFPGTVSRTIEDRPIRTSFLQRAPGLRRRYRYYLPLFPRAVESLALPDTELVVSSSHCVAKGAVKPAGSRHVCYCHTPVRYAWDQREAYFPQTGALAGLRNRLLDRLRRWDVRTAGRVDTYIANSRFVADRIERYYDRPALVVPPPVDTEFFHPGDGPGERSDFCLYVSALAPYKRIDLAAEACRRTGRRLVVVGEGPEKRRLEGRAEVELLGRVSATRLRELYREAACFVQPGVEDFGISSAEALACGCPVVATGAGGVLDIVENGRDGLLVPPDEGTDGLARAIDKIRELRFNPLDLRARAERFAVSSCRERLQAALNP